MKNILAAGRVSFQLPRLEKKKLKVYSKILLNSTQPHNAFL